MPTATFRSIGDYIDYTPGADVAAGAVIVQGDLVGIAMQAIAANRLGALCVRGVVVHPKAAGSAINVGTKLYWDATNQRVATTDASGTNKYLGKAVATAASADTTIHVLLSQ